MDYEEGGNTPREVKPGANAFIDEQLGSTVTTHPKRAGMIKGLMDRGPEKPPAKKKSPSGVAKGVMTTPATPALQGGDLAELRADLLANQRADEAARAAGARKRQEAEDFSKKLKSATTRPAASKTGYDSYKSLMGE